MSPRVPAPLPSIAPRAVTPEMQRAMTAPRIPSPDQRQGNYTTLTSTYLTEPGPISTLYTADMPWALVRLLLETAGPVEVSTYQAFSINGGRGITLQTGVEVPLTVPMGQRIFILSPAVNRVRVIVEPFAWQEQQLGGIVTGLDLVVKVLAGLAQQIAGGR